MVRQVLLFINPHLLFPVTVFSSMCPQMCSKRTQSIILPVTEGKLSGLWLPRSSFLPFLKMGLTFVFLQPLGTSPDLHDLSKMIAYLQGLHLLSQRPWMHPIGSNGLAWVKFFQVTLDLTLHSWSFSFSSNPFTKHRGLRDCW